MRSPLKSPLKNKKIVLGVTGSIAVYKACELLRAFKKSGADVFCMMTPGAQKFVTPLTFGALSGNPVATDIWDEKLWQMAHIAMASKADLVLIAPASANTLARLASGFSDDVIGATVLATQAPVLIAPAMHQEMWNNPATQTNVKKLKTFGMHFVGPEQGELLGSYGWGRFSDPEKILQAAEKLLVK